MTIDGNKSIDLAAFVENNNIKRGVDILDQLEPIIDPNFYIILAKSKKSGDDLIELIKQKKNQAEIYPLQENVTVASLSDRFLQEHAFTILLRFLYVRENLKQFEHLFPIFGLSIWRSSHNKEKIKAEFLVYDPYKNPNIFSAESKLKQKQAYQVYALPYSSEIILPKGISIFT